MIVDKIDCTCVEVVIVIVFQYFMNIVRMKYS